MQYKHWVAKYGITIPSVDEETVMEEEETEAEWAEDLKDDASKMENDMSLSEWVKNWDKREKEREKILQRMSRLARAR